MRQAILATGFSIVAVAFGCTMATAQDSDFVTLVNGDSLDGWKGDLQSWKVTNGTLIGRADGTLRSNRFIVADIEPVRNFELSAEVWISAGGNSGLQYRSKERPDLGQFVVTGYQCDVVSNNENYNGMLYEERGRRILSHTGQKVVIDPQGQPWVVAKMPVHNFAAGEWHQYRVLVEGNHHRHWIDGVPTADLIDLDEQKRSLSGVIGVQVHVGPAMEIRYRNMKLKRLADNLPILTPDEAKIAADAEKVVPQGGWKQAGMFDMNAELNEAKIGDAKNVYRAGDIWLSAQPSSSDVEKLPELGIKTVISLRKPEELDWNERELVESLEIKFVQIPFKEADELSDDIFNQVSELLRINSPGQGVLLHCSSGNRTATVWLVHRVMNGRMAAEQAREEAARAGLTKPGFEDKAVDFLTRKKRM